jgi:hypothetical protein
MDETDSSFQNKKPVKLVDLVDGIDMWMVLLRYL